MRYDYDPETVKEWVGTSHFRAWRADLARFRKHGYSGWGSEPFWVLTVYRAQRAAMASPAGPALLPVRIVLAVIKKVLTIVTHINLPKDADIGPGLLLPHVGPIQVTPASVVGADCTLHHTVTLAATDDGAPRLGDHVMVGCHVVAVGPITVGDGVWLGAGVTVAKDVPAGDIVVPARPRTIGSKLASAGDDQ